MANDNEPLFRDIEALVDGAVAREDITIQQGADIRQALWYTLLESESRPQEQAAGDGWARNGRMSHSTKIGCYTFIHDGNALAGNIEIVNSSGRRFWIMGSALRSFVADCVRDEKIAKLEQASAEEILGLK